MRIELFLCRVSRRTQWRFVRLTTTDGRTGYGELSDSGPLEDVPPYLRRIAATLPAHLAEVPTMQEVQEWADAVLGDLPSTRPARTVLGGVEQAVCDLAAQAREQTVGAWLGATSAPSPIPLYANINRVPTGRSPQEVAVAAAEAAAIMPAVKLAPFDVEVPGRPLALAGLDRVRAVRARIGPDVDIMVDCHRKLALAELLPIVDDVAAEGVTWLEDAVEHTDLVGLDLLRSATDVALAGGEFCHERDQLAPAVEAGLLDVVMPDVKHAGGITRAWRLCAGLPGVRVSPHNPSGPVATLASAHLWHALEQPGPLELMVGEASWRGEIVRPAETLVGGRLLLRGGPGLGAALDVGHPAVEPAGSFTAR